MRNHGSKSESVQVKAGPRVKVRIDKGGSDQGGERQRCQARVDGAESWFESEETSLVGAKGIRVGENKWASEKKKEDGLI